MSSCCTRKRTERCHVFAICTLVGFSMLLGIEKVSLTH